jgi:adenylate cyclase
MQKFIFVLIGFLLIWAESSIAIAQNAKRKQSTPISRVERRKISTRINEYRAKRLEALRAKDLEEAVKITWRIAAAYQELQQNGSVEGEYIKAIGFAQKSENQKLFAYAHERLADNFDNVSYHTKKIEYYQKAAEIYQKLQLTENYGIVEQKIAKFSYEVRKYKPMIPAVENLIANVQAYKLSHAEQEAYCKMMIEAQTEEKNPESVKVYDKLLNELMKVPNREQLLNKALKAKDTEDVDMMLISKREVDILRKVKNDLSEEVETKEDSIQKQQRDLENKQQRLEKQHYELIAKEAESEEQKAKAQLFLIGIACLVVVVGVAVFAFVNKLRANKKLEQKNAEIEAQKAIVEMERKKSDNLLLNILPEETATELKETGKATPKSYEMVTVLFTDFKGFTNIAEKMTAEQVIQELDHCFLAFDQIIDKYDLEKIKTIGDAYMCAGGVPVANATNPQDAVAAGLEMQAFMEQWQKEKKAKNEPYFELRLGIHTGKVVAGVVGNRKFAYDIWGDAVNIASRMESSGEAGKVNISGTTYELVKDKFKATHRGKIAAKNKGEIDMYFVEGKK